MPVANEHPHQLTYARQELWAGVDSIDFKFAKKFRFEETRGSSTDEGPTGPGDCPAVAILPVTVGPDWQFQDIRASYQLLIRTWTSHWNLTTAEQLIARIVTAVKTGDSLKRFKPEFAIRMGMTYLGNSDKGPRVVRSDIQVTLTNCLT